MKIITLCGSLRFKFEMDMVNRQYTMNGDVVLSPIDCRSYTKNPLSEEILKNISNVHFKKIEMSDEIYVVTDKTEYYGDDTKKEIEYAKSLGKPVFICVRKLCYPIEIKTIESFFEDKSKGE